MCPHAPLYSLMNLGIVIQEYAWRTLRSPHCSALKHLKRQGHQAWRTLRSPHCTALKHLRDKAIRHEEHYGHTTVQLKHLRDKAIRHEEHYGHPNVQLSSTSEKAIRHEERHYGHTAVKLKHLREKAIRHEEHYGHTAVQLCEARTVSHNKACRFLVAGVISPTTPQLCLFIQYTKVTPLWSPPPHPTTTKNYIMWNIIWNYDRAKFFKTWYMYACKWMVGYKFKDGVHFP